MTNSLRYGAAALALASLATAAPASAQYAQVIGNDLSRCEGNKGPAIKIFVRGLKSGEGNLFVRTYRAERSDWLKSKRYLSRVDMKPRQGLVVVCVPVPKPGQYAVAVQHDVDGDREVDLFGDGGGMSRNPTVYVTAPGVSKTQFAVGDGVKPITIHMKYR
ncbi:DUF2141 domain-containing protein [Qipengyuania sp. JC766]|uniref:DUF2141 domain-containing protein n=1 Tax=Qipengyuania sp. JC766 TaxID=3232139 RepID=UPI00345814D7